MVFEILNEFRSPPPTWLPKEHMPDCSGKVFIVTGGNSGIGKENVLALLKKGGKVYMGSRDRAKAEEAIAELETLSGRRAIFLELDLANLRSVKRAAGEYMSKETRLNVLFNNGGVMAVPVEKLTSDGYDLQFGTNVIGHFYFAKLLLPVLFATYDANPSDKPRVIHTSSIGHRIFHPSIDFATLKDSPERRKLGTMALYGQSKFGNLVVSKELARRYGDKIVAVGIDPGGIRTNLIRDPGITAKVMNYFLADPWKGAITQLYAGLAPEATDLNGGYLFPFARRGKAHPAVEVPETGTKLWDWLEEQVKDI
ncbi:NAD(P)-binding protein [Auricularia subglabra TFB-10046 SS5]|nr:NAD(P)-binding protein [Auricularia subglabra TFB-10046 SS5]